MSTQWRAVSYLRAGGRQGWGWRWARSSSLLPPSFPGSFPLGWTLVKMEKSKGNWDFDAASSPQSNDALERLCIRGRPLLCAEAGGACERFLPKLAARACCSLF